MKTAMLSVCLSLSAIGFNPQLAMQSFAPQAWDASILGSVLTMTRGDSVIVFGSDWWIARNETESMSGSFALDNGVLTMTVEQSIGTLAEGDELVITRDGAGQLEVAAQLGIESFAAAGQSWTDDAGDAHVVLDPEEITILGALGLGVALAGGAMLALCLGLSTWCANAIKGTLPRRVISVFLCPAGVQCDY